MLEILLLIALGRWLYNLAKTFNKPNKWIYPVFAILTYLGVGILSVLVMMFIAASSGSDIFETMNTAVLGICAIPFGAGGVWLLHFLLKRAWLRQKSQQIDSAELLDAEDSKDDLI